MLSDLTLIRLDLCPVVCGDAHLHLVNGRGFFYLQALQHSSYQECKSKVLRVKNDVPDFYAQEE
jgi:hypothetical protein